MKIKFLSFIVSFFMVSLVITSCLDNDNNVEYSPDATIHAFELDTIGYGKTYKFTIDQLNGEIYNEDSLPVHADIIIDRILIKTLTTSSGIIMMKAKNGVTDSLLNINDSIDLTKYINPTSKDKHLALTVWAPDMQTSKPYYISIRKHKHDPDSLRWQYAGSADNNITDRQRSIVFNNQIFTYTVPANGNSLKVYVNAINSPNSWVANEVSVQGSSKAALPTSIITFKGKLYATFKEDANAYVSDNGFTWDVSSLSNVALFLASVEQKTNAVEEKISYLKKEANKYIFCTTADGVTEDYKNYDIYKEFLTDEAVKKFPNFITSYTSYENRNGSKGVMLIGEAETSTTLSKDKEDIAIALPWGYAEEEIKVNKLDKDGNSILDDNGKNVTDTILVSRWVGLPAGSSYSYCPEMKNPTIIYYNSQFYLFGNGFDTFYVSASGRDWKKATKKFAFPNLDWSKNPAYSIETPEFRGRESYSMVMDKTAKYLIFIFGKESNVKVGDKTYSHNAEVWRARLNQLWFDIANGK